MRSACDQGSGLVDARVKADQFLTNYKKDPLGHGSLTNSDAMGRAVHSAVVSEFDTAVGGSNGSLDPADGKTLGESTTRYDNLGRSVARTQLSPEPEKQELANPKFYAFRFQSSLGDWVVFDDRFPKTSSSSPLWI